MNQPSQPADAISALTSRFEALRVAYERFIGGLDRGEPKDLRQKFTQDLRRMLARPPNNTAQNFRLQAIKARLLTYEAMWERSITAMESSHKRSKANQESRVGQTPQGASADRTATALEALYQEFVAAQPSTVTKQPLTLHAFAAMVDKQTQSIKERTGWQDVGLRVVSNNGRPALQAFRRQTTSS